MIPFLDLQREFRSIQAELEPHVQRVLASGRYILGEEVAQFERQWAEYCGPLALETRMPELIAARVNSIKLIWK